ncbi:MAG: DUF1131 family protein [Arsenophonus sp.]
MLFIASLLSSIGCASIPWSSLYSINCFSSQIKIFAGVVGPVNKIIQMKEQIILAALGNRYHFRSGM